MAQKYIIGDLVKYKVGGLEFIAEITNTSKYGYCFKGVSDDISGTLCEEFVKNIPLTPEILEKNGYSREDGVFGVFSDFKKIINDPARKKGYITCLSIYPFFDNDGFSFFYNNQELAIIHYVHELQHILYGLKINSEMEV